MADDVNAKRGQLCFAAMGAIVVFHGCLQTLSIGMSSLKISLSTPYVQLLFAASLLAAWWFWQARELSVEQRPLDTPALNWPPDIIVVSAILIYLILWAVGYFGEEYTFDGNFYHLPGIQYWANRGYVYWIDDIWPGAVLNGYPKAVELTGFVLFKTFCRSELVNTANLTYLPLGILAVAYVARMLGAARPVAACVGAAWGLLPGNIFQAATLYVDSGFASCVAAFLAAFVCVTCQLRSPDRRATYRAMGILGAAGGLAIGSKASGLPFVLIGFGMVILMLGWTILLHKPERLRTLWRAARSVGLAACILGVVGGYWYVRNYIMTGNPLYPVGLSIAGHQLLPGPSISETLGEEHNTPPELRGQAESTKIIRSWLQVWGWCAGYFSYCAWLGGLGYLWIIGCLPAIVGLAAYQLWRRNWSILATLSLLIIVAGGAFGVQPMRWNPRYTLWLYSVGLPCLGAMMSIAVEACRTPNVTELVASTASSWKAQWRKFASLVPRQLLSGWVAMCLVIAVIEGWLCCYSAATNLEILPFDRDRLATALRARYCDIPQHVLWPELAGTVFDEIFTGSDDVAFGHITPRNGNCHLLIQGAFASPVGKRRMIPLSQPLDRKTLDELIAKDVRYLVWDEELPLPKVLTENRFTIERAPGFHVVRLPMIDSDRAKTSQQGTVKTEDLKP